MATPTQACDRQATGGLIEEDWRNIQDARERKKVQNRIAQRSYRALLFLVFPWLILIRILGKRTQRNLQILENMFKAAKTSDFFPSAEQCTTNVDSPFSPWDQPVSLYGESYNSRQNDSHAGFGGSSNICRRQKKPEAGEKSTEDINDVSNPFEDVFDMNDFLPDSGHGDALWHFRESVVENEAREIPETEHRCRPCLEDQNKQPICCHDTGSHDTFAALSPPEVFLNVLLMPHGMKMC
ncbi:hypothetical protein RRF57_007436 [Xylaria bambusicola]|uniref:Uncharacterized protein n=1 Tax=Xylaria bambusicola TaxID=326684 RepID=A0AAN7UMR9_9PEZI